MPYRRIPKKFDCEIAAAEIKARVLYDDGIDNGIVVRIAGELGVNKQTIYDILDGRIKMSLDFLHALVMASSGDPLLKKYLEPEGYELRPVNQAAPDKKTLAEECLDDLPAAAAYHKALMDPDSSEATIIRHKNRLMCEIEQNHAKWKEGR